MRDLTHKTFGRLIAIRYLGGSKWLCRCSCIDKSETIVESENLLRGATKSCGCLRRELTSIRLKTHGMGHSPEYNVWRKMNERCYNIYDKRYKDWGGRGIIVCSSWNRDNSMGFENFIKDMGSRPSPRHSINRMDNNGNYTPENCNWASLNQQLRNKRNNRMFTINGVTLCLEDWAKKFTINHSTLIEHLNNGKSFCGLYKYYKEKYELDI